jgi:hypothetical protein
MRETRRRRKSPLPCVACQESTGNEVAQEEDKFSLCVGCRKLGYVLVWMAGGNLVLQLAGLAGTGIENSRLIKAGKTLRTVKAEDSRALAFWQSQSAFERDRLDNIPGPASTQRSDARSAIGRARVTNTLEALKAAVLAARRVGAPESGGGKLRSHWPNPQKRRML